MGTASPIEIGWIIGSAIAALFVLWMARDVVADAYNAFRFYDPANPNRLKAAFVHLGFVLLMLLVQVTFIAIGLVAITQPQLSSSPRLSPTQTIISVMFITKLAVVLLLSNYWRWARHEYRATESAKNADRVERRQHERRRS